MFDIVLTIDDVRIKNVYFDNYYLFKNKINWIQRKIAVDKYCVHKKCIQYKSVTINLLQLCFIIT